ncbi:MAG: hypothetical protein Q7S40_04175 [Opitutaceae bacterium]|nr:hypothetical protein [Opitutaceae bacterium]
MLAAAAAIALALTLIDLRGGERNPDAGWRPLPLITDGRIDPGWIQIGWGGLVVDDGALRTAPDPRGLGLLVYRAERLGNCQIRVVFKAKEAKSNAGVCVRLSDGLQNHDPGDIVWFKEVTVRRLPAANEHERAAK